MGHKANPIGLRIGITTSWRSRWFADRLYQKNLREDILIREYILSKWKNAAIAFVEIERSSGSLRLIIGTSRPGVLIGRGGTGVEDLTRSVKRQFFRGKRLDLKIDIQEVKHFEENALLVAEQVAEQLERRLPFRRVLKGTLDQVEKNRLIRGVKIEISGRLGGAEMSRREWLSRGTLPLHTLRADIDFARATARTTYGAIGVKVWLYRGEKFD
ncbi:MAG: 30S ribosomal protein S3 [Candidatus Moraniibacteriota bacterium]|nr:MAG: 30S ribosomal protein S3 [Candidatus Moranbacteria bacterium]